MCILITFNTLSFPSGCVLCFILWCKLLFISSNNHRNTLRHQLQFYDLIFQWTALSCWQCQQGELTLLPLVDSVFLFIVATCDHNLIFYDNVFLSGLHLLLSLSGELVYNETGEITLASAVRKSASLWSFVSSTLRPVKRQQVALHYVSQNRIKVYICLYTILL